MDAYKNIKLSPKERAEDLLSRMTLKEKVGQVNQRLYGFACYERNGNEIALSEEFENEVKNYNGLGVLYGLYRADPWARRDYGTGLEGELAIKAYNMVQKYVIEHSPYGIPTLMSSECPHGHQALDGYLLPVNLAVGATFHPELLEDAFKVCGSQLEEFGVNLALISTLDVLRDPRWGRSEECYSEDPYLSARMAEAAVKGVQSAKVTAVVKHFCAQGEGTGGINASAARIGERELRDIHLPPTIASVNAGAGGIMAAYNEIDGIPCHSNPKLLKDILREELGFKGIVMADGIAIDRLDDMTSDNAKSGALALKSGVDISLWDKGFTKLEQAIELGYVEECILDEAVRKVLELKFTMGLFEQPYLEEDKPCTHYSHEAFPQSLQLARESVVLLKNNNDVLPLNSEAMQTIAVIGPNADDIYRQLGDYTPPIRQENGCTLLKGIERLTNKSGNTKVLFAKGCDITGGTEEEMEQALQIANSCDLIILALGGSSSRFTGAEFDSNGAAIINASLQMDCGEGVDCAHLELAGRQNELVERIAQLHKPIITVLIQGRPYAIETVVMHSEAVLCSFYPGPMGGQAIAEIIFGHTQPSGRLPVSIPRTASQLPVYYNTKASYQAMEYYNEKNTPRYSFGYGLSYQDSSYDIVSLSDIAITTSELREEKYITLECEICNRGDTISYAVPSLYIRQTETDVIPRIKELKAFKKIAIEPWTFQIINFKIDKTMLEYWSMDLKKSIATGKIKLHLEDGGKKIWSGTIDVLQNDSISHS